VIGRRAVGALVATGVAALAVIPAASGSSTPVKKTVKVGDYFLSPKKLTVPRRSTIVWKWPAVPGDSHDVALTKTHPKGVKRWHSDIASSEYSFKRKLTVKGKYVVICTLHPYQMRQTITVR
jgi:plastocyanin